MVHRMRIGGRLMKRKRRAYVGRDTVRKGESIEIKEEKDERTLRAEWVSF